MAANSIRRDSISGLLLGMVPVISYITCLDNPHGILYVKLDNGNDKCQESRNEKTITNDDEFNKITTESEKCDSLASETLITGNIKCF